MKHCDSKNHLMPEQGAQYVEVWKANFRERGYESWLSDFSLEVQQNAQLSPYAPVICPWSQVPAKNHGLLFS